MMGFIPFLQLSKPVEDDLDVVPRCRGVGCRGNEEKPTVRSDIPARARVGNDRDSLVLRKVRLTAAYDTLIRYGALLRKLGSGELDTRRGRDGGGLTVGRLGTLLLFELLEQARHVLELLIDTV